MAPSTLASIARVESQFQPLAINDNTTGKALFPVEQNAAVEEATQLLAAGHSVDIGLMQINSRNLRRMGIDMPRAFDPCVSIATAASILASGYVGGDTRQAQQFALRDSVSRYNTGNPVDGVVNGYVHKVELAARTMVPAFDVAGSPPATQPAVPVDPRAGPSWNVWTDQKQNEQAPPGSDVRDVAEPNLSTSASVWIAPAVPVKTSSNPNKG